LHFINASRIGSPFPSFGLDPTFIISIAIF
jgi:hypothetical protein